MRKLRNFLLFLHIFAMLQKVNYYLQCAKQKPKCAMFYVKEALYLVLR